MPLVQDYSEQENGLWSLAVGLWLDYPNGNEYYTKDRYYNRY